MKNAFQPDHPQIGDFVFAIASRLFRSWMAFHGAHSETSPYTASLLDRLKKQLAAGEKLYLAGINATSHNSGVGLLEVSLDAGIQLICNEEEERYRGEKHFGGFPVESLKSIESHLERIGEKPEAVRAVAGAFDFSVMIPAILGTAASHLPASLSLLRSGAADDAHLFDSLEFVHTADRLRAQLRLPSRPPVVLLNHHDNHAAFSYGVSPFAGSTGPVVVAVLDAYGDTESISVHVAEDGVLRRIWSNHSLLDSLGFFYSVISSTQGGWTPLSSEGRYMGAAAWGDSNRSTNPYYRRLREIFWLAEDGGVYLNRRLANWHVAGGRRPYTPQLEAVLGPPIPPERRWNPDAVLNVDDIQHSTITQERVDKAAATQLVFEDAMFHVVDHALRKTRSDKLVLTGGTALNCVCNMKLLEQFDNTWYRRNCSLDTRLHLWVPPVPGDAGIPISAAYNLALKLGATPSQQPMDHAFYCGFGPTRAEAERTLDATPEIGHFDFGDVDLDRVADFIAFALSRDAVLGIFQGPAETGPRALGHRSILANPCNPRTLDVINRLVKHREAIRPLAPMITLEAARELFHLSDGAETREYCAYNFMTLTARAKPQAFRLVPAVIHRDGTARLQIVRPEIDAFTYGILKAMGRRMGVEATVNTSLNVGSPIVQTLEQALAAMKRSRGLSGLVVIAEGRACVAWHTIEGPVKDAGRMIQRLRAEWD